jgi:predicted TIM-barrel fold metal-dependent hydrolase
MRTIDAWVNADLPRNPAAWQKEVAESLFKKSADAVFRKFSAEELVEQMDEADVSTAILTLHADRPSNTVLSYAEAHPNRFAYSLLVDPRKGVRTTRQIETLARAHNIRVIRVIPSLYNVAPDDRMYFPVYAKCAELGLPVSINTGIPGPMLPGKCQHPMALDDLCLFFPELTVVMANGADPWWDVAIRLMAKYSNLYMMTSAFSPKYLPASLLRFMSSRGKDKVMFATDFPFLGMRQCVAQAKNLALTEDVLGGYLHDNAARVLLGQTVADAVAAT